MNNKPLVSSIIIFLNAEKFIQEAIESVFAQTYANWELLLVDDGSTDDSTQIALRYAEQYPEKVYYLEHSGHQNRGMSATRNLGISQAKGEYIGFLDADDVWLPHALEQQAAILSSYPEAGMVYGSAQYWYGWTGNPEDARRDFRDFVEYGLTDSPKDRQRDFRDLVEESRIKPNTLLEPPKLLNVLLRYGSAPCICSVLMRREVVKSVGGFEEEFRGQYEDQALFVKVGLQTPVFVASGCWSKYRQHPDSSWYITQKTGQHHSARFFFLNWLAEYLYIQGVKDVEIWKLLQDAQLRTYGWQLKKLERALEKERREVLRLTSKQPKKLERALEKERREVRRLRQRNRRLRLRIQDMNRQAQNSLNYRIRKLSKRLGSLRAGLLGR